MRNGKNNKWKPKKYRSYLFVGRDPIMDAIAGIFSDKKIKYSLLQKQGGATVSTYRNWVVKRKTRRPQFCTIAATLCTPAVNKRGIRFDGKGRPYLID